MNLSANRSGVQLTGHGGPAALVWRHNIPLPRPGPGEVPVLAAGVNRTNITPRVGWYPLRDIARAPADLVAGTYPGKLAHIPSEATQ